MICQSSCLQAAVRIYNSICNLVEIMVSEIFTQFLLINETILGHFKKTNNVWRDNTQQNVYKDAQRIYMYMGK